MKILYSVQATGNGHIARADELIPYLSRFGEVDVFLSGSNSTLPTRLPVKYRSKGLSLFYGNTGRLHYGKMIRSFAPLRMIREARDLPVEKYDVVINDFESITALSCKLKNVPFIHFGHQASFSSPLVPLPEKHDRVGAFILRNYAFSKHRVGLHFRNYDESICSPVIKDRIIAADPVNKGHVTVYLSHYSEEVVRSALAMVPDVQFHVFSRQRKTMHREKNIVFMPVTNEGFTESMIGAQGVITGAGFETPAEALYLGKKLLCIPIQGQYEQYCNAAALKEFGVPVVTAIHSSFPEQIRNWLNTVQQQLVLAQSTAATVERVIQKAEVIMANRRFVPAHTFKFSI